MRDLIHLICIMPSKSASVSFSTMKRIETSPEEALFKYQLIKNLMFNLKKITKHSMMRLSINFAKGTEK